MKTIYTVPGQSIVEHEPKSKWFVIHWNSYHGPHFRSSVEAMLAEVKKSGISAYISDASKAKDVPAADDFAWVENVVKPGLVAGGIQKFITVLPASAIAKMTTNRMGKVASSAGVQTIQVATLQEAIDYAEGRKAA